MEAYIKWTASELQPDGFRWTYVVIGNQNSKGSDQYLKIGHTKTFNISKDEMTKVYKSLLPKPAEKAEWE